MTGWCQNRLSKLKSVYDSLPLNLRLLEINKQTKRAARGSQIVKTLGGMFVGETLGTFQLNYQYILHENIGKVLSHGITLVSYCKGNFGSSTDAPKAEFVDQSTLVNLLQKSRAQGVEHFKNSSEHPLG